MELKAKIRGKVFRLYNRFMQRQANFLFRGILETPPLKTSPDAETILYCALDKSSCREYISAAKSFLRYYPHVSVVAQDDGTLDDYCVSEIQHHLKGATVYRKDDMMRCIRESVAPRLLELIPSEEEYDQYTSVKIMYLKFLNVIQRFNGKKIILIDSDLLFLRKPDAIIDWLEKPYWRDFYGEGGNAKSADFYKMGFEFQTLDIADFSSGTIGVGGEVSQDKLIDIFQRIHDYDSSLFKAWEIEQALWSVVMAERQNPINLDELREVYIGSGWRSYRELKEKAVIAHFAGAVRFNNFRYIRLFQDLVKELHELAAVSE